MKKSKTVFAVTFAVVAYANGTPVSARVPDSTKIIIEPVATVSAAYDGDGVEIQEVYRQVVERPGAPWIRIRLGDHDLGENSYITTMSLLDGKIQHHSATTLPEWDNWSAVFNGDAVEVALHVAPGDAGVFIAIDSVAFGEPDDTFHVPVPRDGVASICGNSDNRTSSHDSRVGRMFHGGCTGWLISNSGVLTAGHCTDENGNIGGVLEFNVPQSTSNGRSVAADPEDQYPVIAGSTAYHNNGIGDDWAQFRVGANTETGLRAHIAQGFFRLTDSSPAVDTTLRVTGYGLDNMPEGTGGGNAQCCDSTNDDVCEYNCNSDSLTQQTHTGRLDDIEGYDIEHEVDTLPANSGSPIIWESNGTAIGIHTAGGCDSFGAGYNNFGTHFANPALAGWINDLRGANAIYVDVARNIAIPLGTVFRPYETVALGVGVVANGGVVSIVEGSYPASDGNTFTAGTGNKAMTLEAPVGIVTIGN